LATLVHDGNHLAHRSQLIDNIETNLQRSYLTVFGVMRSNEVRMLYDQTGSGKSNIAVSKHEIPISHFVDKIGTTFSTFTSMFSGSDYPMDYRYFRFEERLLEFPLPLPVRSYSILIEVGQVDFDRILLWRQQTR